MRETAGRLLREIITIKGSRQVLTEETNKEGQRNKETKKQISSISRTLVGAQKEPGFDEVKTFYYILFGVAIKSFHLP